ncbi:MAG TPA: protein-glutamine glutaminase family protein [Solirubrobacteraceae bacterium]|jgi:hypothetical protein|nr:protein-glutamine glutaminase family protein [Solirubrobacteraceae bacterium]
MLPPNAVLSTVVRVERDKDGGAAVHLEGERRARLDPSDERARALGDVLDGLAARGRPAYLELDDSGAITRLLIPHVAHVIGVRPLDEGVLAVDLDSSHARHLLRSGVEDFEALRDRLEESLREGTPVIVTEDDAHEIFDVRAYRPAPGGPDVLPFPRPPLPEPRPRPFPWRLWRWLVEWPWWPWHWLSWFLGCVSPARAQEAFDAMSATSCNPNAVAAPCIPFLYPDDGCWGRAHEMCRLMRNMGLRPRKVWIQGSLVAATRNNPNCKVHWGWHVAPTLCVRGPRFWIRQPQVIDPALFDTPVSKATWKGAQGDPTAALTATDWTRFKWVWDPNLTDPNFTQTNQVLADHRLALQARVAQEGPPPYPQCP